MSKENAIKSLNVAIKGLRVSRKRLEKIIAEKDVNQDPFDRELRKKAGITRKLANIRKRKVLVKAANVIVAAPPPEEIESVVKTINAVEQMALAEAIRRAGVDAIISLASESSTLARKVKV
jgi:hypothetical protein